MGNTGSILGGRGERGEAHDPPGPEAEGFVFAPHAALRAIACYSELTSRGMPGPNVVDTAPFCTYLPFAEVGFRRAISSSTAEMLSVS